jgi:putative ABC transport system substrate-binding protein
MRRGEFITLLGGEAAAWPLAARAQEPAKMLRVGTAAVTERTVSQLTAFFLRLRELGFVEGQNLTLEYIDTNGRIDRTGEAMCGGRS